MENLGELDKLGGMADELGKHDEYDKLQDYTNWVG